MLHGRRSVVHGAAVLEQSFKMGQYMSSYLNKPYLRDYVTKKNQRYVEITKYVHPETQEILSPDEFKALSPKLQLEYEEEMFYVKILTATVEGFNSEHSAAFVADEYELLPSQAVIEESKLIPGIDAYGHNPITVYISSRKYAFGYVQQLLNDAEKTGTIVKHWNILSIIAKCPAERHRPDLPKLPIYVDDDNLSAISEEKYTNLAPHEQTNYIKSEGYYGCLKNCSLFASCKGYLADNQPSSAKTLKPISFLENKLKQVNTGIAKAQLLCEKPSTEGLIYPKFEPERHVITLDTMYKKIFDEEAPTDLTKRSFIKILEQTGHDFFLGLDYGFTHFFSTCLGVVHNNSCYILDVISERELDPMEKIDIMNTHYGDIKDKLVLYPDPESPADIKLARKHGFRCKDFTKDVQGGISSVRVKLAPNLGLDPQLYFLKGDKGVDTLVRSMQVYHWKTDSTTGELTDKPANEGSDECFTEDTEVLTRAGWKSLALVTTDDEVLAVKEWNEAFWEKPSRVINQDYEGLVYDLKHRELSFTATEHHKHAVVPYSSGRITKKIEKLKKREVSELAFESFMAVNTTFPWGGTPSNASRILAIGILASQRQHQ